MIEKQFPSDPCIIQYLSSNYAIEVDSITLLQVGADVNAVIYKIQARDQSSYFVKLKRGHENDMNATLLELLHGAGIQQIIPPIKTYDGRLSQRIDHFSLIVYPFIEGINGFSHKLTDDQWMTLGKVLRQVHQFNVPFSILSHIRRETYSPKWRQMVSFLYVHMQTEPSIDDVIALKFLDFMQEHALEIQRLVKRAEQLCHSVQKLSPKFVLCHSDIHGGNVLIERSQKIYIVDWDAPIMAPKERDLMFIGGGVANVWNDPQEEVSFYKGYGSDDIDMSLLAYYRHERIVEDIAEYGQALLLTKLDDNYKDREEMYKQFISMFDPQGVVEIAFKTDETSQT